MSKYLSGLDLLVSTQRIASTGATAMTQAHRRPFESVAENLMKLGTLALDHFLYSPSVDPPLPDPSIFTNIPTREPPSSSSATEQEGSAATVTPLMLLQTV